MHSNVIDLVMFIIDQIRLGRSLSQVYDLFPKSALHKEVSGMFVMVDHIISLMRINVGREIIMDELDARGHFRDLSIIVVDKLYEEEALIPFVMKCSRKTHYKYPHSVALVMHTIHQLRSGKSFDQTFKLIPNDDSLGYIGTHVNIVEHITWLMCSHKTREAIIDDLVVRGIERQLTTDMVNTIYEEELSDPFIYKVHKERYKYKDMPGRNIVVTTPDGPMTVNRFDKFIGKALIEHGSWGTDEIKLIQNALTMMAQDWKKTVLLDVGANVGALTRAFARMPLPNVQVHAFEAQYQLFLLLAGNVAINNLDNVTVYQGAVSDVTGKHIEFLSVDHDSVMNFGGVGLLDNISSANTNGKTETATTICLDDLNLTEVRLIKIDVEGMEDLVLMGACKTIQQCRPLLFIEAWKVGVASIKRVLAACNYHYYWATNKDILAVPAESYWIPELKRAEVG